MRQTFADTGVPRGCSAQADRCCSEPALDQFFVCAGFWSALSAGALRCGSHHHRKRFNCLPTLARLDGRPTAVLAMNRLASPVEKWFPGGDPVMRQLRGGVQSTRLSSGQVVFHPGDACHNYLLLVSGSLRVRLFSPGGREVVL